LSSSQVRPDDFGGLAVSMLASGTRVRGFNVKEPSNFVNYGLLAKFLGLRSVHSLAEVSHAAWCAAPLEMNDGTPLEG